MIGSYCLLGSSDYGTIYTVTESWFQFPMAEVAIHQFEETRLRLVKSKSFLLFIGCCCALEEFTVHMDKQYRCYYLVFLTGVLSYSVEASDWPRGSYGLPMAKTGCPAGATFKWETGWIYQDTEDDNPQSSKSNSFHIEGQVKSSSVNRSFCIKTDTSGDYYSPRPYWPSGTYCIYRKTGNCPTSFAGGSVKWDDEDDNNGNVHQGTVPRSTQNQWPDTTKIFFCCRDDGPKATAIDLPTASPFYLLAHLSEKCQQVKWAVATSEWIYYDTEDDCYNSDHITHRAPYIYKKETSLKVYYCYYTSCQYSLNTRTGSIESPGFPANYSNGQECSWKISAKANQTIFVRFVNFSLADMDSLKFHDGTSAASPDIVTLDGASTSREIASGVQSSSSNLFVVFHSNEGGSTSSGFKAMYSTTGSEVTAHTITSSTTAKVGSTTRAEETTAAEEITTQQSTRITSRTTTKETEKINPAETTPSSSSTPSSKSSTEPSSPLKGNSSKNYDTFKKTFVQQNQSALIAVAIVIPLICMIAVIAMAAYLFRRLRNLREKPSNVSVRYTTNTTSGPESMNNPSYITTDAVIETRSPRSNNANDDHEDNNGDIYQEVEPNRERQATDNPLYQSTDDDKHVYASFA